MKRAATAPRTRSLHRKRCGGDRAAREAVIALIQQTGLRALDAGALANAVAVETLTAVLIAVNIKYKIKGAGIRLVGVPR